MDVHLCVQVCICVHVYTCILTCQLVLEVLKLWLLRSPPGSGEFLQCLGLH